MPDKRPRAFGYARVSTDEQYKSRLSINEQIAQIKACAERLGLDLGPDGSRIAEEPVSAYKTQFAQRPVGKKLDETLEKGDHIIIAKVDRAFRDMVDAFTRVSAWQARGIVVHLLDIPGYGEGNELFGKLILAILAWCAEFESKRKGERMVEAWRQAKLAGKPFGRICAPPGFKWVGSRKMNTHRLEYFPDEREVMKLFYELHMEQGMPLRRITSMTFRHRMTPFDKRPPWGRMKPTTQEYHHTLIALLIRGESELRYYEAGGMTTYQAAQAWLHAWFRDERPTTEEIAARLFPEKVTSACAAQKPL
ncbi:MAG: recombinase family protein [Gemmataceae bacterium]|nr:recombinase family protein [Gemmataceae bacterium]